MSTARSAHPITVEQYEEFEGFPGLRDELINGRIVMSPQAKPGHQEVAETIFLLLRDKFKKTPYRAAMDTNINFPVLHSMPAPDVFVVRREAWREAVRSDACLSVPPVLVVEVLSPSNRRKQVAEKTEIYLSGHVAAVWTVDPKKKLVTVSTPADEHVVQMGDSIALPAPLQGAVAVADLFRVEED